MAMANILLVEDDHSSAAFVSTWLNSQKHDLEIINDGSQALRKMLDTEFDIILLDWNLPNESGINILREYRKYSCDYVDWQKSNPGQGNRTR
jgi:DNA-binding response OmpR family regulator